jgi:hypothetical protein
MEMVHGDCMVGRTAIVRCEACGAVLTLLGLLLRYGGCEVTRLYDWSRSPALSTVYRSAPRAL